MAGKQIAGDGVPPSLTGLSKSQLYDIMSQMKALIEQNNQQARQILIQNPPLTRALFQAQIMLGMVQSPQTPPSVSSTASQSQQPLAVPKQQPNVQAPSSFPGQVGQNQIRKQQPNQTLTANPQSQPIAPPNTLPQSKPTTTPISQPQSIPSQPIQPMQQPPALLTAQPTPVPISQSSSIPNLPQLPQHTASRPLSHLQPPMSSLSTQSQQPMQNIGGQYMPLQPPLPPQPRPQMPAFSHQVHAQMGPNLGFQHPSGPQMHPSQHTFHSGANSPAGLGPSFPQGQPPLPNQPLPPSMYQAGGGSPHLGMDFNHVGSSRQTDRPQIPGPPSFAGQMGPSNPPTRPPSLSPEMEKALLQQVMSLSQEQINMLPTEQRNQVLQLQQMLRQ